jgi:hypothetical protein
MGVALACLTDGTCGELQYPGRLPGASAVTCGRGGIIISNEALRVEWQLGPSGLRIKSAEDEQTRKLLEFRGELFEVKIADERTYAASAFVPVSEARIKKLAGRASGNAVEVPMQSSDGRLRVLWRAIARKNANYIRQEIEITIGKESCVIQQIRWLDEPIAGAIPQGQVDGSPLTAGTFFMGCEDPHALNQADATGSRPGSVPSVSCLVRPDLRLHEGERLKLSFVLGVVPEGQLRRGFLCYLEHERAHPYRPFLHYNSWYDIAWDPFALNETNCLEAIGLIGERLTRTHGVVMDAMVFDDGWDNPQTLWQFHRGFPRGFAPLAALCKSYQTHLGVWLSPFGGYGESRNQRLKFGAAQGYETNATGFSLAGSNYYAAFKRACVGMIRNYGVNHFKFDGIATGMYAQGSADYYRDTEAMRRLMLELRQEDPNLYINLTTGSWPSPFWLRYADSVWRQGGDMGLAGKGPRQQQWLTYRDREVYRNIVRKAPLFPLNSLMTQGVAYSRRGSAGDPEFDSAGFKDDVLAFFGSGTGLQELYIQPGKLTSSDWAVLAEAAKWSRANSDVLVDTHWIGGDPAQREIYGYAAWNSRKGIIMLRNPDDQPHDFKLVLANVFELPPGAAARYALKSPWAEEAAKPLMHARSDTEVRVGLQPFGVRIWEATPEK